MNRDWIQKRAKNIAEQIKIKARLNVLRKELKQIEKEEK